MGEKSTSAGIVFGIEGGAGLIMEMIIIYVILGIGVVIAIKICWDYNKKSQLRENSIIEKFPDANGYRIISNLGVQEYIYVDDHLYIIIFSERKPYTIVYCRELDDSDGKEINKEVCRMSALRKQMSKG